MLGRNSTSQYFIFIITILIHSSIFIEYFNALTSYFSPCERLLVVAIIHANYEGVDIPRSKLTTRLVSVFTGLGMRIYPIFSYPFSTWIRGVGNYLRLDFNIFNFSL